MPRTFFMDLNRLDDDVPGIPNNAGKVEVHAGAPRHIDHRHGQDSVHPLQAQATEKEMTTEQKIGKLRVLVDESLPPGVAEFRDPRTGEVLGRIVNLEIAPSKPEVTP